MRRVWLVDVYVGAADALLMTLSRKLAHLDPRTLIVLTVLFALVTVSLQNVTVLLALLLFAIGLCFLFQVPFGQTVKRLLLVDLFVLLAVLSLPFTMNTGPSISVAGVALSQEGIWLATKIALKANAVFLCFSALLSQLSVPAFAHALAHLYVPPVFVQILLLMVRYVDVLQDELAHMRAAMKCRGFRLTNRWHVWKSLGQLVGMLFVRSFERAELVHAAMKCRGFQGTFPLLHHFHATRFDWVFGVGFVLVLASVIWGSWR